MGLIEKSRKFFSNFLQPHSDPDSENTAVKPPVPKSEGPRWKPLRGPAMIYSGFRGEKRKRESDDGCFYRQKNRLLKGGWIKAVTEEEMDYDDLKCRPLIEILYPEIAEGIMPEIWPTFAIEELEAAQARLESQDSFESRDSFEPQDTLEPQDIFESQDNFEPQDSLASQDSFEGLPSDLSCTLDNLTVIDDDDIIMWTPYTSSEGYSDSEVSCMESISEWGDTYLARRRDSESSIEVPLYPDVAINELPIDSGLRSVPPQLDWAPSLTGPLTGFAPDGHIPDTSDDGFLKELFEQWLEYRMKAPPRSEYSVKMSDEVEDVNTDARAKAKAEASWDTEMETEAVIETQAGAEREVQARAGVGAGMETEFEPRMEIKLEETGAVTTVDEANVRERSGGEIEELEMGEADASVSGEATGTTLEPGGTERETETATVDYRTEMEEADKENTRPKEADDGERVRAYEAISEDAMMDGLEETTPETTPETTSETVYINKVAGEPEPRAPEPKTPEPQTPEQNPEPRAPERRNPEPRNPEPKTPTPATVSESAPEPTSPTPAAPKRMTALKLAFRTVYSLFQQVGTISDDDYGFDPCFRCQRIDAILIKRIIDVREMVMEELLDIDEGLRIVVECETKRKKDNEDGGDGASS
ncbi:uncharacterized protein Triagg1_10043 [Trichoderma aggressivum f. europaeum]|uniref:Uncharacterized protein n=1 Tax=Trichoderma aggressivum f. europaeum TaxID=173218 RepID=A0AAE1I9J3_9HYPO|nr:hypothetical protein Triagg1_10043 [Trichoderma aggressivum f. europaeum]